MVLVSDKKVIEAAQEMQNAGLAHVEHREPALLKHLDFAVEMKEAIALISRTKLTSMTAPYHAILLLWCRENHYFWYPTAPERVVQRYLTAGWQSQQWAEPIWRAAILENRKRS